LSWQAYVSVLLTCLVSKSDDRLDDLIGLLPAGGLCQVVGVVETFLSFSERVGVVSMQAHASMLQQVRNTFVTLCFIKHAAVGQTYAKVSLYKLN
jgi:hypothetical protein